MSVIARDPHNNKLYLMTKGADSVMMNLFEQTADFQMIDKSLQDFAVEGLRVLVMGQREIEEDEYEEWHNE